MILSGKANLILFSKLQFIYNHNIITDKIYLLPDEEPEWPDPDERDDHELRPGDTDALPLCDGPELLAMERIEPDCPDGLLTLPISTDLLL